MEKFKADDIYIIRPMILVQANKYVKYKLPHEVLTKINFNDKFGLRINKFTKKPSAHVKQTYLSLANDITMAELNNNEFIDIFNGKTYPNYSNALDCFDDSETFFIHQDYAKKLSVKLFQERTVSESSNISLNDIINNGIYESLTLNLDEIAEKIINQDFDLEQLTEIRNKVISKEKDKLIIIDSLFTPSQSQENLSSNSNQDLVIQKVLTKDKNIKHICGLK